MTRTSKRIGPMLLGLLLAVPAGSQGAEQTNYGKGDYSTVGSGPQFPTEAERKKFDAPRMSLDGTVATPQDAAGSLPPKSAEISTILPGTAVKDAPVVAKPSRPDPVSPNFTDVEPAGLKAPEKSTCEPGTPGLTAAELAKLEALRRKSATSHESGRPHP